VVLAIALDNQARAEGLDVPSVAEHVRERQQLTFHEHLFNLLGRRQVKP
jgi:hypothetical protein